MVGWPPAGSAVGGGVLAYERLVDVEQDALLSLGECRVGDHGGGRDGCRGGGGVGVVEESGPDVQGLDPDAQAVRDLLEDLGARLAQAALDLAEVRVGTPASRASWRIDTCACSRCSRM